MLIKPFFNYRIFIWVLLSIAIVMGGVFLSIAYTYNLQKETEKVIEISRSSVNEAKEMENELTAIKGLTYTYMANRSDVWLDSLNNRKAKFILHLERARGRANTPEEQFLIQQISALFSNYEQNMLSATRLIESGEYSKANALLLYSANGLLVTIQEKSNEFIKMNVTTENLHESQLERSNIVIRKILLSLGIGGIASGLLLGWLLSRMLFGPLNRLILAIRGVSGDTILEELKRYHGGELDELGERIKDLIDRINQANQDLSRNKELLQYSNKFATLGKIAPTIAHEIRNPLAAIKMLVYSIREQSGISEEIKQDLEIISKEIDRMESFTKDFLRFAKPSEPVFSLINPVDSLTEVIQLLKPRLNKGNIQLNLDINKVKILLHADSAQLKQVYMNIILNAVEVMPSGGTISIECRTVNGSQTEVMNSSRDFFEIDFGDSGPGIPEAIMKTLFEPFIRGSDKGVGIGLSISQSVANSHGGWISAFNKREGKGAVFSLYLPLPHESSHDNS